jgi:antitoxin component YwqK of YwqJK toxin-antitoxin module
LYIGNYIELLSKQRTTQFFYGVLCFLFFSCQQNNKNDNEIIKEIRIAKTIPNVFINASDKNLTKQQDTLLYHQHLLTGIVFSLFPNGDTASIQSYFNGVEEGFQKKWYPNHQIAEERFYINGKKEGIHKGWWPDGKQKFIFELYNNDYDGEFKEWYSTGLLAKQFHYKNGQEEGSQKLWWDNGTIRANYVIKKGKKYGLIGVKLCVNPNDSITKK